MHNGGMTSSHHKTPQQAWDSLREGNQRFMRGESDHPHQDLSRRITLQAGQKPQAVVLACSDSRAPVEILFDQGLGDVFVIRTAGEITDLSASRSTPANPDVHDSASAIRSSEAHSDTPGTQTAAGSKEGW